VKYQQKNVYTFNYKQGFNDYNIGGWGGGEGVI
jgi:hypothetical protein